MNPVSKFSAKDHAIEDECCRSQVDAITAANAEVTPLTAPSDDVVTQSRDFIEYQHYVADWLSFPDQLDRKDPSWRE